MATPPDAELHKGLKQRHLTMIAIGGVIYEGGTHWVLARGTDNSLYFGESFQNQYLAPN